MSTSALVAVVVAVAGSLVWAVGTARLARANPTEVVPRSTNVGWRGYWRFYLAGLAGAVTAAVVLPNEVGLWSAVVALVVVVLPYVLVTAVHRRRVRARLVGAQQERR